jgi:hypothetical protein
MDDHALDAFHERATNRGLLFRAVAEGRFTPAQAEVIAATEGYGPLLTSATYAEIDGFAEPAWSLLMAFAWIAWGRSPTHVREYFVPYRRRLQVWKQYGAGHRPEPADMPTAFDAVKLSLGDRHDDFAAAFGKVEGGRASMAWDRLTAKFRTGEITTEGQLVNDLAAGIVPIPPKNWRTLQLMPPTGALVDALCYADGNPIYFSVTADREQLLSAFPGPAENEMPAPGLSQFPPPAPPKRNACKKAFMDLVMASPRHKTKTKSQLAQWAKEEFGLGPTQWRDVRALVMSELEARHVAHVWSDPGRPKSA